MKQHLPIFLLAFAASFSAVAWSPLSAPKPVIAAPSTVIAGPSQRPAQVRALSMQAARSMPPGPARDAALLATYRRMIKGDLPKAVALAEREPKLRAAARNELVNAIEALAAKDVAKAWPLMLRLMAVDTAISAENLINPWALRKPEQCVAALLALPPGTERAELLRSAFSIWLGSNTQGFLAWLRRRPQETILPYLEGCARLDGRATWAELVEVGQILPFEAIQSGKWADLISDKVRSDPSALADARRAVLTFLDVETRDQSWLGLAQAMMENDPSAAAAFAQEIVDPRSRAAALAAIAAHLVGKGPQVALDFARSLPDELCRQSALGSAVASWLLQTPGEASAWIKSHLNEFSPEMLSTLGSHMARADRIGYADWVVSLPDSAQREKLAGAVRRWLDDDWEGFLKWARGAVGQPGFSALMRSQYFGGKSFSGPQAAELVELVPDAAARQRAAKNLLKTWSTMDAAAAARWHETAIRSGRITMEKEQASVLAQAASRAETRGGSIHVERRNHSYTACGITAAQAFYYRAEGLSFNVFY